MGFLFCGTHCIYETMQQVIQRGNLSFSLLMRMKICFEFQFAKLLWFLNCYDAL